MPTVDKIYPGAFREGNSYLHLFDPRLKLLLLGGLAACLFSAAGGWRLVILFLLWLAGAGCCSNGWRDGLKVFGMMRWLLLFTLLLHLFFTPGRTLLGTSWLSYDGLLRGLLVDAQVLLAVFFSMLLAWTTRPERLAWALTCLLSPLQRFKLPVREAGGLLLLVLQFFPLIREEVAGVQQEDVSSLRGLAAVKTKAALVGPLLLRLVDRADRLAVDIASGAHPQSIEAETADRQLSRFDWVFFSAVGGAILLIWLI